MKVIPLPLETQARTGFTHKFVVTYEDVADLGAGTTGTIALFPTSGTFAAGTACFAAAFNLKTAFDFSDSNINSLVGEVGDGTDPNRMIGQTQLAEDGTQILFDAGANSTKPYAYVEADTIDLKFTVAGGGSPLLSETTVGELEVYLAIVDLNTLEQPHYNPNTVSNP